MANLANNLKTRRTTRTWLHALASGLSVSVGSVAVHAQAMSYPAMPVIPAQACGDITGFGAVGDGATDNTQAIQNALDSCSNAGGGTVTISTGTFLSGPITLRNSTNLQLASDAALQMLPYGTYPDPPPAFLAGTKVHDVQISGSGTIDGQGQAWWDAFGADKTIKRPTLIAFNGATRVAVFGVTTLNPPVNHISIGQTTRDASVIGVTITAPSNAPNTDGVDIWGANVLVAACNIATGDDNIALDSGHSLGATNVTITHNNFGTGHGLSIGSFTNAPGVSNLTADDNTFDGTDTVIRMKSNRGRGSVSQNLSYTNLNAINVKRAFSIVSYYPESTAPTDPSTDPGQPVTATTPSWKNISVDHMTVSNISAEAGRIIGLPEAPIDGLSLNDVNLSSFPAGLRLWQANNVSFTGSTLGAISAYNAPYTTGPVRTEFNLTAYLGLVTVGAGSAAGYTQTVTSFGGFSGTVALAVDGLPAGATATFSPASIDTSGTSLLSVTTSTTTPHGYYPLKITGTSGALSVSTTVILVVSGTPAATRGLFNP